jgi:hypothetical protein
MFGRFDALVQRVGKCELLPAASACGNRLVSVLASQPARGYRGGLRPRFAGGTE